MGHAYKPLTKTELKAQAKRTAAFMAQRNAEISEGLARRADAVATVIAKMGKPAAMEESKGLYFPTKLTFDVNGVRVVVEVHD